MQLCLEFRLGNQQGLSLVEPILAFWTISLVDCLFGTKDLKTYTAHAKVLSKEVGRPAHFAL